MYEGHLSNPALMIESKGNMEKALEEITTLCNTLAKDTATYAANINDNVSENAKAMVTRTLAIVNEINEELHRRLDNVEKAAKLQINIEKRAKS